MGVRRFTDEVQVDVGWTEISLGATLNMLHHVAMLWRYGVGHLSRNGIN